MYFKETRLKGVFIVEPELKHDERGFFARVWCKKEFETNNLNSSLSQSNISYNKRKGTVRGMHYQTPPYEETKLVRCTKGSIFDVIIDLRHHSPTYKEWIGIELSEDNHKILYVPAGFAHGYQTFVDNTEVLYQVSQFYNPEAEHGVRWDDPIFGIDWPERENIIISYKDKSWPDYTPY